MPKYVCDFDKVKEVGTKLTTVATEMTSSIDSFKSKISSDLSSWTGDAKTEFDGIVEVEVTSSKANATEVEKVGNHIKEAATKIEALEEELAALSI